LSSWKESRSQATSRVTGATAAWFWRRKSRVIVAEVGITKKSTYLEPPWGSWYRVDLVVSLGAETHVIEVKGTKADLAREILDDGKWTLKYPNFRPWLAFDARVTGYEKLPDHWGLLRVDEHRVKVLREPPARVDEHKQRSLDVLASCLCMQSLPTLMGKPMAKQAAELECVDRPWRRWITEPGDEESGHIL